MSLHTPNKCSVVLDYRASNETIQNLKNMGYNVVLTQKIDALQPSVNGHADMQVFIADKKIIVANEVYEHYKNIFGNSVICAEKKLKTSYPYDVLYNAACVNDFIICNQSYIAKEIIEFAKKSNKTILNIKQGYSKCSIGIIGKNAIVTADKGIAKNCKKSNIDVLLIEPGNIKLTGMNYGFIGGCCGMLEENCIGFNGELVYHPQGSEIKQFCIKHSIEVIELKRGVLEDIGSILVFNSDKE